MSEQRYIEGLCRNERHNVKSHLYAIEGDDLFPMCGYGWNRSDGEAFSIFRGHTSRQGTCLVCQKRALMDLPPLRGGWPHKTKWL